MFVCLRWDAFYLRGKKPEVSPGFAFIPQQGMRSCASPGPCRLPAPPDMRCPVAVFAVLLLGTELSHAELSVLDKNRHQPLRAAASPRSELRALHRAERALLLRSLRGAPGEAALQRERCVSAGGAAVPLHCRIPAALCPCLQHILQQSGRGCAAPALTVLSPPVQPRSRELSWAGH